MNAQQLKLKLKNCERLYMTLTVANHPLWATKLASSGIDAVFVDSEHIPNDRLGLSWVVNNYQKSNLSTFVRVSSHDPYEVVRVMDGGANGILVPYVETKEQVKTLVGAVKYRPLKGEKLTGVINGTVILTNEEKQYLDNFNRDNYLLINIESIKGMENLEDIVQTDGVDGIIVGPHDLSVSLGIAEQYHHAKFDEAIKYIIETCRKHNKSVGVHSTNLELQIKWCTYGMNIVIYSNDLEIFSRNLLNELNEVRSANNEPLFGSSKEVII